MSRLEELTKEVLIELYINRKMSSREIAVDYGCDKGCITRRLRMWGLDVRTNSEAKRMESGHKPNSRGYIELHRDGRSVKEHRLLMEQHLGRPLRSDEEVHHKDGDKTNNDIDNLEVVSSKKHKAIHDEIRKQERLDFVVNFYMAYKRAPTRQDFKDFGIKDVTFFKDWGGSKKAWEKLEEMTGYNPTKDDSRLKVFSEDFVFRSIEKFEKSHKRMPVALEYKKLCGVTYQGITSRLGGRDNFLKAYDEWKTK